MPRASGDAEPISGSARTPEEAPRLVYSSRKWLLVLAMFILGIPVFLVMLGPPVAGGWILWQQYALYREEGRWHEFSVFDLATLTLEENLAANLRWPGLAACSGFQDAQPSSPNPAAQPSERAGLECPQLGPWQSWLLHPASSPEWHRRVAGVFRFLPVSSLLFLLGLILSFLLRLFGADWRFRSAPPPPPPLSSSAAAREITSRPPASAEPEA